MGEEAATSKNPFILPNDPIEFREIMRKEKDLEREARMNRDQPFWERMNFGSVMSDTRRMVDNIPPAFRPGDKKRIDAAVKQQLSTAASLTRDRRGAHESLTSLVAKKRETLLTQLSIEHKELEMLRLKKELKNREEALNKAEEALEEDAISFDTFFHNNDEAATAAVKRAEKVAESKAEKAAEIKRIKNSTASVMGEVTKLAETLEQFRHFSQYLDALTPPEWFQAARDRQAEKRADLRAQELVNREKSWEILREAKEAELVLKFAAERKQCLRRGKEYHTPDVAATALTFLPPRPQLSDIPLPELSEEEMIVPMFFRDPAQLKVIFEGLEKSNLFLIQQFQDLEQSLEEIRLQQVETDKAMAEADATLAHSVADLEAQIAAEEGKAAALREKLFAGGVDTVGRGEAATGVGGGGGEEMGKGVGGSGGNILELIQPALRARVVSIYERCGFKATPSSDIISMLTGLEAKLDSVLEGLVVLNPVYLATKFKEKERERRGRVMAARKAKEAALHTQRLDAMLARALVPPPKIVHRSVMYRSILPKNEVTATVLDEREVEEKLRQEEEGTFFS